MKFCTAINCIDGRAQIPVIEYLQNRFAADYVDVVSEPGVNLVLSKNEDQGVINSIISKVNISIEKHDSLGVAVVGHFDCAANPASQIDQIAQIKESCLNLKSKLDEIEIIGLWVNDNWNVEEIDFSGE